MLEVKILVLHDTCVLSRPNDTNVHSLIARHPIASFVLPDGDGSQGTSLHEWTLHPCLHDITFVRSGFAKKQVYITNPGIAAKQCGPEAYHCRQ